MLKNPKDIAEDAEAETIAQLEIIRALKPLSDEQRSRVMRAAGLLLEAESQVKGILVAFCEGTKNVR